MPSCLRDRVGRPRHLISAGFGLLLAATLFSGCVATPNADAADPEVLTEDEAFAIADATYRSYVDGLNQVDLSDPTTFEGVYRWASGSTLGEIRKFLTGLAAENVTVSGVSKVTVSSLYSTDPTEGVTVIDVCVDVSTITLVDDEGNSRVSKDRPDIQRVRITVESLKSSPTVAHAGPRADGPTCI